MICDFHSGVFYFILFLLNLIGFLRVMINWRENAGGPSARIEEVIRALRRMGVNPVAGTVLLFGNSPGFSLSTQIFRYQLAKEGKFPFLERENLTAQPSSILLINKRFIRQIPVLSFVIGF